MAAESWSCHAIRAPKARWSGELLGVQWGRGTLGVSMHWRLSTHVGLEEDMARTGRAAGWERPCTGGAQINGERRATRQTHRTRRAWVFHTLEALNSPWTGGGHGVGWRRGRLGEAMERTRPRLGGPESSAANTQDTARLGVPYTGGFQLTVDWRRTWRWLEARQAGSCQRERKGWSQAAHRTKASRTPARYPCSVWPLNEAVNPEESYRKLVLG